MTAADHELLRRTIDQERSDGFLVDSADYEDVIPFPYREPYREAGRAPCHHQQQPCCHLQEWDDMYDRIDYLDESIDLVAMDNDRRIKMLTWWLMALMATVILHLVIDAAGFISH